MRKLILLSCFVIICQFSTKVLAAKEKEFKFGKITPEELSVTTCPIDSNAHAYYLFDNGKAFYWYNNGFQIQYDRHFRIKILDKSGLDNATITIPYYDYGASRENVTGLKAFTYNLEGGKMVKTQLEKENIFDEETTKYWRQKKFALPNVKEGSVIEVSYSVRSPRYWDMPGWQLQAYIPIIYSSYDVKIPEYFKFNQFHRGYVMAKTISGNSNTSIPSSDGKTISYSETTYNYTIENVPAFPVGEELTTPKNYVASIEYELASVQFPGAVYKDYSVSWEDVNKQFLEDEEFGIRFRTTGYLKDTASVIMASSTNDMEKMKLVFNLIKRKMKWDGKSSCWSHSPLKKSFESGVGNSADINLNLVSLLKESGLNAFPIVLSTRENGMIHPTNPSINQMNYVIAMCRIDGNAYLMDATDKYSEIDVLPTRCLNGKGWIVDKNYSGWEPLLKGKKSKENTLYNLTLTPEGLFTGTIDVSYQDFKALKKRNAIKDFESEDKYIEKLQESNSGLTIKSYKFENLDTTEVDLKSKMEVEIINKVENAGDLLYFTPLLFDAYEKNPFSLEKREYPVEYPYPISEYVVINIILPDGYKVESLPSSQKVTALDNSCQFLFNATVLANKISVVSNLQINQTMIPGTQYSDIKGFFEQVVKKHLEQVVLKKI